MLNQIFLESNVVGVNKLFVLVYPNQDNRSNGSKGYKAKRYYLPKEVIKNYNGIINGRNFFDQPVDSNIK